MNRKIRLLAIATTGLLLGACATAPKPLQGAFTPVTPRDAAEAAEAEGFKVERRQFVLTAPIKELGLHDVRVHLHPEVDATIRLNVARSAEEAKLQASGKSIQELAAEEEAAAEFEIAELFDDIGSAGRDEDEGDN